MHKHMEKDVIESYSGHEYEYLMWDALTNTEFENDKSHPGWAKT